MSFIDSPKFKIQLIVKNKQNKAYKLLTKLVVEKDKTFILGRSQVNSHIVLNDPNASRQHFEFKIIDNQIYIEDLVTKNGTFLNGKKVDQSIITQGDTITLGDHTILVSKIYKVDSSEEITSVMKCEKVEATVQFEIIRGCGVA